MVRFIIALLLLFTLPAFGAYSMGTNTLNVDTVGTTSTGTNTPISDFTTNPGQYVSVSSCPTSATAGHNYGFYDKTGAAFKVTTGQKFYVTSESWECAAASAVIPLQTSTTAPTWDNTTGITSAAGVFWDGTNVTTPFTCLAANTTYRSHDPFTIDGDKYPYIHANNPTQQCLRLTGIMK